MSSFNKYRLVFWYGIIFAGLIIAIIFEGQFFITKVNALAQTQKDLSAQVALLQQRNVALSSIAPELVAESKEISTVLPAENSVLLVTSQVRNAAIFNKVTIKNLTTNSLSDETDPKAGSTQVGVIIEGDTPSVINFLASLVTLSPIVELNTVNFLTNPTSTIAQIQLDSYWSPFPSQLPAITDAVQTLSPDETALLQRLSSYTQPTLTSGDESTSSAIVVNTAPFAPVQ